MSKGTLVLIALVMLPVGFILSGYTLSFLWSWFIVTKFGLPALNIAEAIGITIVARYLVMNMTKTDRDDDDNERKAVRLVVLPFAKTVILLGLGWFVHLFI